MASKSGRTQALIIFVSKTSLTGRVVLTRFLSTGILKRKEKNEKRKKIQGHEWMIAEAQIACVAVRISAPKIENWQGWLQCNKITMSNSIFLINEK